MKIGIICGHQINGLFQKSEKVSVDTAFGSVQLIHGQVSNHQCFFLNRHGTHSNLPPHTVQYKANIQALAASHVDCVLSVGTVGSMNTDIVPGDFVIPHDFFDATKSRSMSFFDDRRVHVDMTEPFCPDLRKKLFETCEKQDGISFHRNGIYVTTEGPRLETISEIRFFATIGEIVGMTLVPEVVLAREKGFCFASLCLVCNMAAGLQHSLSVDDIKRVYAENESRLADLLRDTISSLSKTHDCTCTQKHEDAFL